MAVEDLHLVAASEAAAEVLAEEERAPAGDRAAATVVERRTAKHGARAILWRDGLTRASTWSCEHEHATMPTAKRWGPPLEFNL